MIEVDAVTGRYVPQPGIAAVADGRCTPTCGKISFEMTHCADCGRRVRLEDAEDGACGACALRRKIKETEHA